MSALISVIVPVYNRERIIGDCIQSILNQKYDNLQIIIVDDGSQDNTFSVCKQYAAANDNIILVKQNNQGVATARNNGMDIATGEFFFFVDSDDQLHPECLMYMYNAIADTNADIAFCDYRIIEHRNDLKTNPDKNKRYDITTSENAIKKILYSKKYSVYCWGKLWKRSVVDTVRFKKISFCEDAVFVSESLLSGKWSIVELKGVPLYDYFQDSGSVTKSLSSRHFRDSFRSAQLIQQKISYNAKVRNAGVCYYLNTAFFAYLNSNDPIIKKESMQIIKHYRKINIFDIFSPLKTKLACVISFFSMKILQMFYGVIRNLK